MGFVPFAGSPAPEPTSTYSPLIDHQIFLLSKSTAQPIISPVVGALAPDHKPDTATCVLTLLV